MEREIEMKLSKFKRICVFCGSSPGNKTSYKDAAIELGKELVSRNIDLVYGGGSIGLMGLISQAVYDGGRHVIGVIPKTLMPRELTGETVGEVKAVADMHQRKAEMARNSDAFIALPGFSMSRGYNYIKHLKKNLDVYKIGFRVLDSWNVSASNGNQHMEFIIGDAKGDCVHVLTRYKEFEQWRSLIEECKTYTLYNCHVFDNDVVFKHVDHPFKVVFGFGTKVQRNDNLIDIPAHEFRFKPFKEIEDGNFKTDVLYEIIGLLHEIVKTTTGGSGKKPSTNIVLKDESGKLIDVTLLEKYSLALMKFLADRKDTGPVVVILTHAQCKLAGILIFASIVWRYTLTHQYAQKLAEARKVYAEDRQAEVELLERSIEELETTVNVLESNADFIKGEAERHWLQREDLEMELCALKDQIFLDEKEKSLEEAQNHIQVLKSDIAGKGAEVYNPANGESIADVACMGGRETNDAISSAFDAYRCGYGTLEELLEVITWAQLGIHDKPVGLLNVDGYYNSFLTFIDKAVEEGFISPTARHIIVSAPTPKELVKNMEEYFPQHERVASKLSWENEQLD